jgi:type II secretory pathway component PulK
MMKRKRRGFSLMVAIFVIVLLSTVAGYIFYVSSHISKQGQIQYQREQALILARSYTEYAIMAIQGHNRESSGECLNRIDATIGEPFTGRGYKIEVRIKYVGNKRYLEKCSLLDVTAFLDDNSEDSLFAIIDVYIRYKDILHKNMGTSYESYIPWQTYHKRSIQKI